MLKKHFNEGLGEHCGEEHERVEQELTRMNQEAGLITCCNRLRQQNAPA